VLDVIGEDVPCEQYNKWIVYGPDGNSFQCCANRDKYRELIRTQGGPDALEEWLALEKAMEPMQVGAGLFPAAGMRGDIGVLFTALQYGLRAGFAFARTGLVANKLTGPFSAVVDPVRSAFYIRGAGCVIVPAPAAAAAANKPVASRPSFNSS
jgi:hypothetical protein